MKRFLSRYRISKTFLTWVLSYIVVLVLPITVSSFLYRSSLKTLQDETEKIHSANLSQLQTHMDEKLGELRRISSEVSSFSTVKIFMSLDPPLTPANEYKKKEIQEYLQQIKLANSFVEEIFIYFRKNDYFLSSDSIYRADGYEQMSVSKFGTGAATIFDFIDGTQYLGYRIIEADSNAENRKIVMVQNIYSYNYSFKDATIIIAMNSNKLLDLLGSYSQMEEFVFITDDQNRTFSAVPATPPYFDYGLFDSLQEPLHVNHEDRSLTIMHTPSSVCDWHYVSVIPSNIYLEKVEYIKNLIYLYIAICLLVGLAGVFYFARRNYKPIKSLASLVNDADSPSDELKALERGLKSLIEERETSETRLWRQTVSLRNAFLYRLLKGRIRFEGVDELPLEEYDIHFPSSQFVVVLIKNEAMPSSFLDGQDKYQDLAYFAVKNIFEELLNEKYTAYGVEIDGMTGCLVSVHIDDEISKRIVEKEIEVIAERGKKVLAERLEIYVSVAISSIYSPANNISYAYSEAIEAIDYNAFIGEHFVVTRYASLPDARFTNYDMIHSLNSDRQILSCIIKEDYDAAKHLMNILFEKEFKEKSLPLQMAKFRMFGLSYSIIGALGEGKTALEKSLINEINPIDRILNALTLSDLREQTGYIFDKIIEFRGALNKETVSVRVDEIEDFIKSHFHENELSVARICDKFNITPSYFSRIFKRHTGMNLPEYLHGIRIEQVKRLLVSTDLTLGEIAEKTGFYNSHTLGRVFRNLEGMAPGQYRKENRIG